MARDTGKAASERSLPGPLGGERRVRARGCGDGGLCGDGLRIRGGTATAAAAAARRAHGGSAAGHTQVHGAHGVGRLVVADVPFIAIAEAAVGSVTPAPHVAVIQARAGVARAESHGERGTVGPELYRSHGARCLVVADGSRVAVAEPPVEAKAPASHARVVEPGARKAVTDG